MADIHGNGNPVHLTGALYVVWTLLKQYSKLDIENSIMSMMAYQQFHRQPGETMDEIRQRIENEGRAEFLKGLRERWFGERMRIKGRGIVDDRGVMIMADSATIEGSDPSVLAAKVRADWGVVL